MLNKDILKAELRKFVDEEYAGFQGFPTTGEEAATKWAGAIDRYVSTIIPPTTTLQAAKAAFASNMGAMIKAGKVDFSVLFASYAGTVAAGMQPINTGIPPINPLMIDAVVVLGLGGATSEVCADLLATIIHLWFSTGIAVNNSSGVSVTWL